MYIRIILEFLKNTNAQLLLLFSKATAALLLSSHAQRQLDCLTLYHVCFTLSAPISFVFPFLHLFFFFDILSQVFIKYRRKAFVYIYIITWIIHILENLQILAC